MAPADSWLDMPTAGRSDAIWAVGTTDPGATRFAGRPTAELIDETGQSLVAVTAFDDGFPQWGWSEGVLASSPDGPTQYEGVDLPAGDTRPLPDGEVLDTHGSLVALAPRDSSLGDVVVEDLVTGTETRIPFGSVVSEGIREAPAIGSATFSPDGRLLTVVASRSNGTEPPGELVIVDIEQSISERVPGAEPSFHSRVVWAPDGDALFFSGPARTTAEPGVLGYHRLGEERAHTTAVDFDGRPEAQAAASTAIPFGPGSAAQIAVTSGEGPSLPPADGLPACRVEPGSSAESITGDLPRLPPGPCRLS